MIKMFASLSHNSFILQKKSDKIQAGC